MFEQPTPKDLAPISAEIYTWLLSRLPSDILFDIERLDQVAEEAVKHAHRLWLAADRFLR